MGTPPGWYPDPWRLAALRWWDGYQWTPYISSVPPAAPGLSSAEIASAHRTEEHIWKWARLALCSLSALFTFEAIAFFVAGSGFRQLIHQASINSQHHLDTAPPASTFIEVFAAFGVVWVLGMLFIPLYIVLMIWQYNAAKVARASGYPAELSPAFGVACWFIPFLNFWFPYWALRDCLPPGHPMRPKILRAWLVYILNLVPYYLASALSIVSWVAALVPLLVTMGMTVAAIVLWSRCVTAIREDHLQRLAMTAGH